MRIPNRGAWNALAVGLLLGACKGGTIKAEETGAIGDDSQGGGGGTEDDADGDGYTVEGGDCDDEDAAVNPGVNETCDGVDQDCDGSTDEDAADASTTFADADGDGYGDPATGITACTADTGRVPDDSDCDDSNAAINPAGAEACDGVDNDCDRIVDENPGTNSDTWYLDHDGDGYGDPSFTAIACEQPAGYVADATDCDDLVSASHPGADEVCDGADNDCDGAPDEDAVDAGSYATDADGDGLGAIGSMAVACSGVDNEWDCDDADPAEPQVADASARGGVGDGSLDAPWETVTEAMNVASSCVIAMPGTYIEAIDFRGVDLDVWGVGGPEATLVYAIGTGQSAATFEAGETSAAVLHGFTLVGDGHYSTDSGTGSCASASSCTEYYYITCGGGVYVKDSSPTLEDLILDGNSLPTAQTIASLDYASFVLSYGGGLCVEDGSAAVTGVEFRGNFAQVGGGLYVDDSSSVTLSQSLFDGNTATDGAAIGVAGTLAMTNVLSTWNEGSATAGALLVSNGSVDAVNVTVGGDDSPYGGGVYVYGTGAATVLNSIVWGAETGEGVLADSTATFVGTYNDVYDNAGGNYSGTSDPTGYDGNIAVDPDFEDVTDDGDSSNDVWALYRGSPCIDAGNPDAAYYDADGTANDMGTYGGPGGDW